jgi:hypothetical protein
VSIVYDQEKPEWLRENLSSEESPKNKKKKYFTSDEFKKQTLRGVGCVKYE